MFRMSCVLQYKTPIDEIGRARSAGGFALFEIEDKSDQFIVFFARPNDVRRIVFFAKDEGGEPIPACLA